MVEIREEEPKLPRIHFLRHATTSKNIYRQSVTKAEISEEYRLAVKYIDTQLHEQGIQECLTLQSSLNEFNIQYVFTSPLLRSMETTKLVLLAHPNRNNIRIIVHPLLIEFLSASNDFPQNLEETRKRYEGIPELNFDFHLFDGYEIPEQFYMEYLKEENREIIKNLMGKTPGDKAFVDYVLMAYKQIYPEKLEETDNPRIRLDKFLLYMQNFMQEAGITGAQDILIVTHSRLMKLLLQRQFPEKDITKLVVPNASFIEFKY